MKRQVIVWVIAALVPAPSYADSPQDRMTQGRIDADLGHYAAAARAFAAVADAADAPAALRAESLVRLGAVRRAGRDFEGSFAAFQQASKHPGLDRETKALLVEALGGAVPGVERWAEIWPRVTFVADRTDPARPGLAIRWPDVAPAAPRYEGDRISLDVNDGDLLDVLRLFSVIGKVNVVADPGVQGRVTVKLKEVPWDQALAQILATHGLTSRREDDVVWVSAIGGLRSKSAYSGQPISVDFKNGELADVMPLFADISELNVVAPGVAGRVNLTLKGMPWDKAFDIVLKMHGLVYRREGNVLWVSSGWMPPVRRYTGHAIDIEWKGARVIEALNEVAQRGGGHVTLDPELGHGPQMLPITLKLRQVPWDQALDLVARWGHLEVIGEGDRLTVRPIVRSGGQRPGARGGLARFAVREVTLRGVVDRKDAGYVALLLAPDGKTYFPQVGATLQDGKIRMIDAAGVTFEEQADGGTREVRKSLPAGGSTGSRRYRGSPISVDYKDADLADVFRLFADVSGLNVVVFPGTHGRATFAAKDVPWDEALDRILAPNGLAYQLDGDVLLIGAPRQLGTARKDARTRPTRYEGAPLDLDLKNEDLRTALSQLAASGGATVTFDPRIQGRVTIKLMRVPWDQAFDVIVMVNGLKWERRDNVLEVSAP